MTNPLRPVHRLRNVPISRIVRALKLDESTLSRKSRSSGRASTHPDGKVS